MRLHVVESSYHCIVCCSTCKIFYCMCFAAVDVRCPGRRRRSEHCSCGPTKQLMTDNFPLPSCHLIVVMFQWTDTVRALTLCSNMISVHFQETLCRGLLVLGPVKSYLCIKSERRFRWCP